MRGYHGHTPSVFRLYEHDLRMVLTKIHLVKTPIHQIIQFDGLPAGFEVCEHHGVCDEVFLPQVIES